MAYDKSQATHEFTRWSESYDRSILQLLLFGPSHRALIARLKAAHGDRPFKVLDVGCGTGIFAERLREALPNAQVWGMDLVRGMLDKGAQRWQRLASDVLPVQGDSENLPFADGSFDAVTCANSFHHYPNQARAVAEIRRVLAPGGRMLLIDGYRDALWGWFIFDVCVAGIEGDVHHASAQTMRSYCESAGFAETGQKVHRGPAPFLLTDAQTPAAVPSKAVPTPHFGRTAKVVR